MKSYDVAVIGGGPAGMMAAVQCCRSDLSVALFERNALGGLLNNANLVENFPCGKIGIPGTELVKIFIRHLRNFDLDIHFDEISALARRDKGIFTLRGNSTRCNARAVIVAAGTIPKRLKIKGAEHVDEGRIAYEIRELYPIRKGRTYVIIGGGDAVFDYALSLCRYDSSVSILIRSDSPDCLPLLARRVREHKDHIRVRFETTVESIHEDEKSGKLIVHINTKGVKSHILTDHILIAIGRERNDALLRRFSDNESTFTKITINGKTNIPGLYLAGDIIRGSYRQTGIAVGDGLRAAMMAAEFIDGANRR